MKLYDVVILQVDLPEEGLSKGMRGTIVAVLDVPQAAYEVEFCNANGETIAELALTTDQLQTP